MTIEKTTSYAIRLKSTGALLRVENTLDGYGGGCVRFTTDENYPVWTVSKPIEIARALAQDVWRENSSAEHPMRGRIDVADMEPVELTVTTDIKTVLFDVPPMIKSTLDSRDIPPGVARRYAKTKLPASNRYTLVIAHLPDGVSREEMDKLAGKPAMLGSAWNMRLVAAVCDAPEELEVLFKGKPGVMLICLPQDIAHSVKIMCDVEDDVATAKP